MRTQLRPLLCEVAKSTAVLCSGRKGSCCWDRQSHPAGCAGWKRARRPRSCLRGSLLRSEQRSLPRTQLRAHVCWESWEEVLVLARAPW